MPCFLLYVSSSAVCLTTLLSTERYTKITTTLATVYLDYYILYSLSVSSLAKSLQLTLEICATYRLVSYLLADSRLIRRLRAQCMISKNNVNSGSLRRCLSLFSSKQCKIKQFLDSLF